MCPAPLTWTTTIVVASHASVPSDSGSSVGTVYAAASIQSISATADPLREPGRQRHDRERRVGGALGGHDAAVRDEQVAHAPDAVVAVNHAVLGPRAHPAAAHEMRRAVDRERILRARRLPDPLEHADAVGDVRLVVVAARVVE